MRSYLVIATMLGAALGAAIPAAKPDYYQDVNRRCNSRKLCDAMLQLFENYNYGGHMEWYGYAPDQIAEDADSASCADHAFSWGVSSAMMRDDVGRYSCQLYQDKGCKGKSFSIQKNEKAINSESGGWRFENKIQSFKCYRPTPAGN